MDTRLITARANLLPYEEDLRSLYPDLVSVGTPCYTLPPRVSFRLKLRDSKYRCVLASRLALELKLGRRLQPHETCDHVDGDITNDSPENLQILSRQENARKGACPAVQDIARVKRSIAMTGRSAPWNKSLRNANAKLSDAQVVEIRNRCTPYIRGLDSRLAKEYGVSRELISSIRRGVCRRDC